MAIVLHFILYTIVVFLSFSPKQIQSRSEGTLLCESSTIDQYKCIWESASISRNVTYEIESKINLKGNLGLLKPLKDETHGNRTIYYFDSDKTGSGHYSEQTVSMYRKNVSSRRRTRVSNLTFNPYLQAIPNTVTDVELNVTEMHNIDVTWQRPSDLTDSPRDLWYKLRYWNEQVSKTTETKYDQQYTIRGLSPYTTYSISLVCRFKLQVLDEEAKWSKQTTTTVTTTGSGSATSTPTSTSTSTAGVSQWLYFLISVISGMALVVVVVLFVIQIKRKCFHLELKNSSEILSSALKWKDFTYTPATTEKEYYNELRHPQTTNLLAASHHVISSELSSVPDVTAVQESFEHVPSQNGDGIIPIDFKPTPTLAEDQMSDSSSPLYSYVKINFANGGLRDSQTRSTDVSVCDVYPICDDTAIDSFGRREERRNVCMKTELKKSNSCRDDETKYGEKLKNGYVPINQAMI